MQDIAINLSNYTLLVTESPATKMKELDDGSSEPVVNRDGEVQFVVSIFAKPKPITGRRTPKGEEIRVNLPVDPGEGFEAGTYVELIDPVLNSYEIPDRDNPRTLASAGLLFKAAGLKPLYQQAYPSTVSDDLS